jgi:hypothetical protein
LEKKADLQQIPRQYEAQRVSADVLVLPKAGDVEGVEILNCQLRNKLGKGNVPSKMKDDGFEILRK